MRLPRFTAAQVAGVLVALLGAAIGARWLFELDSIARVLPGSERLGPINPLLFVAAGICLLGSALPARKPWIDRCTLVCSGLLVLLPLGFLFETVAGVPLGIDIGPKGSVPTPANPNPGRMSPNASLGFLFAGIAFWLWRRPLAGWWRTGYLALVACVAAIGLGGLAGHALGLEELYRVAGFNRMLPPTAVGLSMLGAGLWLLHDQSERWDAVQAREFERRIGRRSVAVVTLVALGCGVAGFAALRDTFEKSVSQNMSLTATTTATSLAHAIDVSLWFPRTVASRPTVTQTLDKLSTNQNDPVAREFLQKVADSFLTAELTGVEFYNAGGVLVGSAGAMVRGKAQVVHPMRNTGQTAFLAWHDGYLLVTENDVRSDGQRVGRSVTEQRLPLFDRLLGELRSLNETSDAAICGRDEAKAVCGPNRLRPTAFERPLFDAQGQPSLPIVRALLGERGVQYFKDTRGRSVISAFAPIKDFGLGLAVRNDVEMLYAPLRARLNALALALTGIIVLAICVQRSQVRPALLRLVQSEQSVKAIIEEQSELVSLATPDGVLTYVNPAYARHFGLTPGDMVGSNLFDHVDPADRDQVRLKIAAVIAGDQPSKNENRMLAKNGSVRWVSWTNRCQRDASGAALLHSVGRDVTERRTAQEALLRSQAILERTGHVAGVGGWELDLATGDLEWTAETRRIHGVGPQFKPTLDTALEFYSPENRAVVSAAVEQGIHDGRPWNLELPLVTATGRRIWVHAQGQAEFEHGRPVRLVGAFQDITERKQLEQRLAQSESFVRKVTDSLPVRIAYVDKETRYQFVNLAHSRRFALPRESIIGRTRRELTPSTSDDAIESAMAAVLAGREQRFEFEEIADGKSVCIESRLIPDIGDDGSVRGFYSTGVDITERSAADRALRELTTIFDNTTDYVVQADWRGQITYMNPAVRRSLGMTLDEPVAGRSFTEFNTSETNQLFAEVIVPATKAKGVWVGNTTVYAAGNQVVPVNHMVIAHRGTDGRVSRYSAIMRDISDEVRARQEQERQAATLRSVTEALPAIVAVVGADGRYRFVNSAFERWVGAQRGSIIGRSLPEVLGRIDAERCQPWVERVLSGETVNFEREYPNRSAARHLAVTYIPMWLDSASVDGFVGVAQDITQHKQEEGRLLQLSQRDALTGLLNRSGFEQYLRTQRSHGVDAGVQSLALLYIDLDHFKPVNDTHGHPVGDKVLQQFAQRLQNAVRPTDAVARLGGDEFAIALVGVRESAHAHAIADKVIAAAGMPFEVGALTLHVGASVGVAFGADTAIEWEELVARADAMLYQAKASGRGRQAGST